MSLAGRRVVVTRATHQADEIKQLLTDAGAIPVMYPCIEIIPPADTTDLDVALKNIDTFDCVIFTSRNTVFAIHNQLHELNLSVDWKRLRIASVGAKTNAVIEDLFGKSADFIPTSYTANDLATQLPVINGQHVLLPQSALANGELTEWLLARGVRVTTVEAYDNIIGTDGEDVPALLRENKIDALTFTSGSTVENFVKRISPETAFDIPAICIGSSTYNVAIEQGFQTAIYPDKYTLQDMVALLDNIFEEGIHGNTRKS